MKKWHLFLIFLLVLPQYVEAQIQPGINYSFESYNYPGKFIRHKNFLGHLDPEDGTELFGKDATFKVVPGLADNKQVSFESTNYPGYYLRHQGFRLKLQRYTTDSNRTLFQKDATFLIRQGLAGKFCLSFESYNYPGHFIRHKGFKLYLDKREENKLFREDATFWARNPRWPKYELFEDYATEMSPPVLTIAYNVPHFGRYTTQFHSDESVIIYPSNRNIDVTYSLRNKTEKNYRFHVSLVYNRKFYSAQLVDFQGATTVNVRHRVNFKTGTTGRLRVEATDILSQPIGDDTRPVYFSGSLNINRACPQKRECCEPQPDGSCGSCRPICP